MRRAGDGGNALRSTLLNPLRIAPGTAAELAGRLGHHEGVVRNALAELFFEQREVTCDKRGRYGLGDPTPLILMER